MENNLRYDNKLWEERYQNHRNDLIDHEKRISILETFKAGTEKEIKNLIASIDNLTATMKWFMGLLGGSFVGFFFYFVKTKM